MIDTEKKVKNITFSRLPNFSDGIYIQNKYNNIPSELVIITSHVPGK
jgi:hypothetical protein